MTRSAYSATGLLAAGATFLAMLDTTVVNLAVPRIAARFPASTAAETLSGASWVITLYAIVFAALLVPAGRFADVVGRRSLLVFGVATFTAMSLLGALAPTLPVLLAARGLQAVGAAAMVPASLAVVLTDTPPAQRVKVVGLWSAAGALAAAIGPGLGGLLMDAAGWRALFAINVPVGIALIFGALRLTARQSGAPRARVPDLIGTASLAGGIGLVVWGTGEGRVWGWDSAPTLTSLCAGSALVAFVLVRSPRQEVPAVATHLWRDRTFLRANLAAFAFGAALFTWMLVGVLVLMQQWRYSALAAGLALSPGALVASATAIIGSRVGKRLSPRAYAFAGSLVFGAVGLFCRFTLPGSSSFLGYWLPLSFVIGVAIGMLSWSVSAVAVMSAGPAEFAGAIGMSTACRQVGGALGVAVMTVLVADRPGVDGFRLCYLACGLCSLAAALALAPAPRRGARTGRTSPASRHEAPLKERVGR